MTSLGCMRPCLQKKEKKKKISLLSYASYATHRVFLHTRSSLSSSQELTRPDPWWAGSSTSFSPTLVGTTPRYVPTLGIFS